VLAAPLFYRHTRIYFPRKTDCLLF
jgi:hypothetical protein